MPKDLWKWAVVLIGVLIATYWISYASRKAKVTKSVRCADQLDLPDKGATLGDMTPLQASNLALECRQVFNRWASSGSDSDALAEKLMKLTQDQLYAVQAVYNSTYETPLVDEIENDWAYMGLDKLLGGTASQLVNRLKALQTGVN